MQILVFIKSKTNTNNLYIIVQLKFDLFLVIIVLAFRIDSEIKPQDGSMKRENQRQLYQLTQIYIQRETS